MKTIIIDDITYNLVLTEPVGNEWRLPTVDELMVMFDRKTDKPIIEGFNSGYYWSSTTDEGSKSRAWSIYFNSGDVNRNNKGNSGYARCVRDGKDGLEWSKSSSEEMTWEEAIDYAKTREGIKE